MHQQSPLAVIGAGTLGWQIALKFAFRGIEVRLQDAFPEALARGVALIEAEIAAVIDSGDSPAESIDAKSRIIACESLAFAVDGAWLVGRRSSRPNAAERLATPALSLALCGEPVETRRSREPLLLPDAASRGRLIARVTETLLLYEELLEARLLRRCCVTPTLR